MNETAQKENHDTQTGANGSGNGYQPNGGLKGKFRRWVRRLGNRHVGERVHEILDRRADDDRPLTAEEQTLMAAAVEFHDVEADDLAIPRNEIVALNHDDPYRSVMRAFIASGHSRLPVCGRDLDELLGFVTLKDVVAFTEKEKEFALNHILRPITYVPDSMPIFRVLQQMRRARVQMAIVVDEYGGTSGLITLKDILEKLVGSLDDENDRADPVMIFPVSPGRYKLDPRLDIDELAARLRVDFGFDEGERPYDTVGGYILSLLGRVPENGEQVKLPGGHTLVVKEADGRRLQVLELILKPVT